MAEALCTGTYSCRVEKNRVINIRHGISHIYMMFVCLSVNLEIPCLNLKPFRIKQKRNSNILFCFILKGLLIQLGINEVYHCFCIIQHFLLTRIAGRE